MLSFFVDSLVTGLMALTLSTIGGEENNKFLPLIPMALVEGVSTGRELTKVRPLFVGT
jgi:hypothetical protein